MLKCDKGKGAIRGNVNQCLAEWAVLTDALAETLAKAYGDAKKAEMRLRLMLDKVMTEFNEERENKD